MRIPLRVVFYQEEGRWIAHCLEFDLVGDGATKDEALDCLSGAIALQVGESLRYRNAANLFAPAEGRYFEMFAAGQDVARGQLDVSLRHIRESSPLIEQVDVREYVDCGSDLVPA